MIFSDEIYEHLRAYLEKRKRLWILEHNKDQAMVLSKARFSQLFRNCALYDFGKEWNLLF
jgi:PHD/YefM family antitoxin component YafN of YafNO toxin-antitoxin module